MTRIRTVFLTASLTVVVLFAGLAVADRQVQEELFRAMGNLAEVVHLVRTEYVDELDPAALEASLDAGILESVEPWAAVLPAELAEKAEAVLEAPPPYGLVLGLRLSSAAVRATLAGSPARDAGLEPGEVIEQVEGVYTRGRPLWDIRMELLDRQGRGESARLTVIDRLVDERREVVLEPKPWAPRWPVVEEISGVRTITLTNLSPGTAERLAPLLEGASAVVLDLREVVWGVESEAVGVADLLAEDGVLALWRGRRAGERAFAATPSKADVGPVAAVIGPETEGVGEILAAALARTGVVLVGGKTAGHAPHMRLIRDDELNLWIPVAHWLRPDDTPITRNGVEPTEAVDDEAALDRAIALVTVVDERAA